MNEINNILDKNERMLWEGKPKFSPYFINFLIAYSIFIVMFSIPLMFIISILSGDISILFSMTAPFILMLLLVASLLITLDYKNRHYAITNKRIIVQSGIVGRDFKIIDYDKFDNAIANVGILDKLFNTGTIQVIGNISFTFFHIPNPYEVFKHFKKISFDVKTDIFFPNKYRPKENPGYNTKYNPKQ